MKSLLRYIRNYIYSNTLKYKITLQSNSNYRNRDKKKEYIYVLKFECYHRNLTYIILTKLQMKRINTKLGKLYLRKTSYNYICINIGICHNLYLLFHIYIILI